MPNGEPGQKSPSNQDGSGGADQTSIDDIADSINTDELDEDTAEAVSQLVEKGKQLDAQKRHHREKREELEDKMDTDTETDTDNSQPEDISELGEKVNFLLKHTGEDYTKEDIDFMDKYAKAHDMSLEEAAEDEDVQEVLETRREKRETEEKVPSSTAPQPQDSDKPSSKEIADMSEEEFQQLDEQTMQNAANSGV